MAVDPGTRFGPVQIVALIGSGGMGEVYRARDSRLGRDVAVKVLPATFSADTERLQRFEQEARAAAALNHPNILALYDIGSHDPSTGSGQAGCPYLVTELLEGHTLREHLSGPLSSRQAIEYGTQIARGLAAAHDRGIVHRDLKPENLFVTTDGRVKILDFGLAKLRGVEPDGSDQARTPSMLPTAMPDTMPGVILGTAGYMAPEQVRGLAADSRADIFAFGAVLYEMLAGRRAFRGETTMDTMTAILKEDPPELPTVERQIPPALTRIVDWCLAKNPAARFKSADDLAFALEGVSGQTRVEAVPAAAHTRGRGWFSREAAAWTLAGVAVLVAAWLSMSTLRIASTEAPVTRFSISAPEGTFFPLNAPQMPAVVSPDGRQIVFSVLANGGTQSQLWVRSMESVEARLLPGTEAAGSPFWSPDGRFVAFFAGGTLKRVSVAGGPPQVICEVAGGPGAGGTWNSDGLILFSRNLPGPLFQVPSTVGAQASPATTLDSAQGETGHSWPQFLPDGRHFIYNAQPSNAIFVGSLAGEAPKPLVIADSKALYADGYLLFVRQGTLLAQPFDAVLRELSGEPVAIAERIGARAATSGSSAFSVSGTGVLTYRTVSNVASRLVWFDRGGRPLGTLGEEANYGQVAASRDGRQIAATRDGGLWLIDVERNVSRRLASWPVGGDPVWSPDGRYLASERPTPVQDIFRIDLAAGQGTLILGSEANKFTEDWSWDGKFIAYITPNLGRTIGILPTTGDRKPFVFLEDAFTKDEPHFSPDSRWIAYESDESGQFDVYVQSFPGPGPKVRVSTNGSGAPRWRGDSKELFYLTPEGMLMAVPVSVSASFEPGVPQALFQTPIAFVQLNNDQYDVTADGQRFLFIAPAGRATQTPFTVVLNWTAGLKK